MAISQIGLVLLFILNLLLLWLVIFNERFAWYRFPGYVLLLIIPLGMVFPGQPHFELDYFWWRIAGVIAIIAGAVINYWARLALGKWHETAPQTLVTSGPYQYVRHPMYLGLIFIVVGWWWIWAAAYAFYFGMIVVALIWLHAYLEEKLVLEKNFGEKYREYRRQAGMFWIK
jgi:protein-S-isoprenylcysteine O-methyltransferase Ste14